MKTKINDLRERVHILNLKLIIIVIPLDFQKIDSHLVSPVLSEHSLVDLHEIIWEFIMSFYTGLQVRVFDFQGVPEQGGLEY